MAVTRSPMDLSRVPMLLVITPLPMPLITPPLTRMYFVSSFVELQTEKWENNNFDKSNRFVVHIPHFWFQLVLFLD